MLAVLFDVFIYILALYGAVYLIIGFIDSIRKRISIEKPGVKLILLIKNQEDYIEGIIRSIAAEEFLKDEIFEDKFTILDMGSKDDTLKILERLKNDYQYLNILKYENKDEIFKYFEEDN